MTESPKGKDLDGDGTRKAERVMSAARKAVRAAVREHKLLGNPIAGRRNGKNVLIPPDEIEI